MYIKIILLFFLLLYIVTGQNSTYPDGYVSKIQLDRLKRESELKTKNKKNMIYFLHMHKAAGTSICELSSINKMHRPAANCIPAHKGGPGRNWVHVGSWDIKAQISWAQSSSYSFIANEFTPIQHLPLPGTFTYITCIRDPLDRILSHYKYVSVWYPRFIAGHRNFELPHSNKFPWKSFIEFLQDPHRDEVQTGEIENVVSLKHKIYPHNFGTHNFQTHMLTNCGKKCDSNHYELAKMRLNYFSVIMIMEKLNQCVKLLKDKLGWQTANNHQSHSHQNTHSDTRDTLRNHPELLEMLEEWNSFDLKLYQYANELTNEQLNDMKEHNQDRNKNKRIREDTVTT